MEANAQIFWLENLKSASNYNRWIFSQIRPFLGSEVLEIGCGNGNFSVFMAQHCRRLVALDLDESHVQMARERLRFYSNVSILTADATKLDWQNSFDTIVMLDVLEHIENDIAILCKLLNCLRSGGNLIIKVPALKCLCSPMDSAIGHYRRYNKGVLRQVFTGANLSVSQMWYFNMMGIPGWWLNGKVLKRSIPPSGQIGLFDKLVPLLSSLEAVVDIPVGLSLFAVVSKP